MSSESRFLAEQQQVNINNNRRIKRRSKEDSEEPLEVSDYNTERAEMPSATLVFIVRHAMELEISCS